MERFGTGYNVLRKFNDDQLRAMYRACGKYSIERGHARDAADFAWICNADSAESIRYYHKTQLHRGVRLSMSIALSAICQAQLAAGMGCKGGCNYEQELKDLPNLLARAAGCDPGVFIYDHIYG